jgi:hypothetical protein
MFLLYYFESVYKLSSNFTEKSLCGLKGFSSADSKAKPEGQNSAAEFSGVRP